MLSRRIIPCLDVRDGKVVKGVHFVGIQEVGDPVELARQYNDQRADELVFLDITATWQGRKTMVDVVRKVAEQVFIPLTVGGGISSIEQIRELLSSGADKISLNSAPWTIRSSLNRQPGPMAAPALCWRLMPGKWKTARGTATKPAAGLIPARMRLNGPGKEPAWEQAKSF